MKIRSLLFSALLVIIIVVAGVLFFVFNSLDSLVEAAIEKYGSEVTQTAVRVNKVQITLKEGEASIAGLRVANPEGFSEPNAFTLGQISARINVNSVTEQTIVIDEVRIDAPAIFYEINKAGKANLNILKQNVAAATQANKPEQVKADEPEKPDAAGETKLVIRRFILDSGSVKATIMSLNGKIMESALPRLELTNVGGSNGATGEQLAAQITEQIIELALSAVARMGAEKYLGKGIKDQLDDGLLNKIDQPLGSDKNQVGEALDKLFAK